MCTYKTLVEFAASADFLPIVKKGIDGYLQPEGACSYFSTLCGTATTLKEANDEAGLKELVGFVQRHYAGKATEWLWMVDIFLEASKSSGDSVEIALQKVRPYRFGKILKGRQPVIEYAIDCYIESQEYEKIIRLAQKVIMKNHRENAFGYILKKEAFKILYNYIVNGIRCNEPRYYLKGLPRRKKEIVSAFKALDLIKQTTTN